MAHQAAGARVAHVDRAKAKTDQILKELDAFQAATEAVGRASDPVVDQYLLRLSRLINAIRQILREP